MATTKPEIACYGKADLLNMFDDSAFKKYTPTICYPNTLYVNENGGDKIAVLVAQRNFKSTDWAVNKNGLDYVCAAERDGKIKFAMVVLASGMNVVAAESAMHVAKTLRETIPNEGKFGPYWWVTAQLQPAGRYVEDDAAPF
jgi:hypothetical protein